MHIDNASNGAAVGPAAALETGPARRHGRGALPARPPHLLLKQPWQQQRHQGGNSTTFWRQAPISVAIFESATKGLSAVFTNIQGGPFGQMVGLGCL